MTPNLLFAVADTELLDLARFHVVDVALGQDVIRLLSWLVDPGVVMDGDLPGAHDFKAVASDDDCGLF